jgi:hypothetical protein
VFWYPDDLDIKETINVEINQGSDRTMVELLRTSE